MGKYYSIPVARQILGLSPKEMEKALWQGRLVVEMLNGRRYLTTNQLLIVSKFKPVNLPLGK